MSVAAADPSFRPVNLGELAPVDVAARLRPAGGLVFFDSALERPGHAGLSLIGAAPSQILRGTLERDADILRSLLASRERPGAVDDGLPHGFAAGWVEYDGRF